MNGDIMGGDALGEDVDSVEIEEELDGDMGKVSKRTKMKPKASDSTCRSQQAKIERPSLEPRGNTRGR